MNLNNRPVKILELETWADDPKYVSVLDAVYTDNNESLTEEECNRLTDKYYMDLLTEAWERALAAAESMEDR